MKHLLSAASVVLLLAILSSLSPLNAQTTLYTWTDAKGRVHITDTPPPPDAKIKDVIEQTEPTPAEVRQLQDAQRRRVETRQDEQRRTETEEALRRAREAALEVDAAAIARKSPSIRSASSPCASSRPSLARKQAR